MTPKGKRTSYMGHLPWLPHHSRALQQVDLARIETLCTCTWSTFGHFRLDYKSPNCSHTRPIKCTCFEEWVLCRHAREQRGENKSTGLVKSLSFRFIKLSCSFPFLLPGLSRSVNTISDHAGMIVYTQVPRTWLDPHDLSIMSSEESELRHDWLSAESSIGKAVCILASGARGPKFLPCVHVWFTLARNVES